MSEPDLIRNDAPHQVTLAEGTNMAIGKKADASEPSVRKVLADTEGLVIEHSLQDDLVALPEAVPETPSVVFVPDVPKVAHAAEGPVVERSQHDHFVDVPAVAPEKMRHFNLSAPDLVVDEPLVMLKASAESESPALSAEMEFMLQMDFPARVVKLKIENDKVRSKLDVLQFTIRN
jgi:hypothetical protein